MHTRDQTQTHTCSSWCRCCSGSRFFRVSDAPVLQNTLPCCWATNTKHDETHEMFSLIGFGLMSKCCVKSQNSENERGRSIRSKTRSTEHLILMTDLSLVCCCTIKCYGCKLDGKSACIFHAVFVSWGFWVMLSWNYSCSHDCGA